MIISMIIVHFSQADIERRAEMKIKELQTTTVAKLEAELLEKPKMDVNGTDKDQ